MLGACLPATRGLLEGSEAAHADRRRPWPHPARPACSYVDQMPLTDVQERCPEALYTGLEPFPLPLFVPHNQTFVDIHPGANGAGTEETEQHVGVSWRDGTAWGTAGASLRALLRRHVGLLGPA